MQPQAPAVRRCPRVRAKALRANPVVQRLAWLCRGPAEWTGNGPRSSGASSVAEWSRATPFAAACQGRAECLAHGTGGCGGWGGMRAKKGLCA